MTAPEFVMMLQGAPAALGVDDFLARVNAPPREHLAYPANAHCRFQMENGLCGIYPVRALSCRLHGHDALRTDAPPEMEFCELKPTGYQSLQPATLHGMITAIQSLNTDSGLFYVEPYFMINLNLECWLDFFIHPEYSAARPSLTPLREYLDSHLGTIPGLQSKTRTTLGAKLSEIDRLFDSIQRGMLDSILQHLQSLQFDYPSCSSYWVAEARHFSAILTGMEPSATENG